MAGLVQIFSHFSSALVNAHRVSGDSRAARAQLKELRFSHVVLISAPFGSYVSLAYIKASH